MKKILLPFSIVVLFVACSVSKSVQVPVPDLYQKWNLIYLNGDSVQVAEQSPVYLEFHDSASRVTGSGGCNRFFSTFRLQDQKITIQPVASTKMACLDDHRSERETAFFHALSVADTYEWSKGVLLLKQQDKVIAAFAPSNAVPDELAGYWELFYITGRKIAFNGLYPDKKPTLTFTLGQAVFSGFTSCNAMSATWRKAEKGPLFKPGVMTLMACPGEGEQVFLDFFKRVDDYDVSNDTLLLYDNNIPVMKFVRKNEIPLQ